MLKDLTILVRGAGEMATGVAHRLFRAHFKICLTDTANPQAVRRGVAFSEAVYDGEKEVEGAVARLIKSHGEITDVWKAGEIPLLIDPEAKVKSFLKPDVLIDAILAKENLGTKITDASFVIGLGPGFYAGRDVHVVIETNRGHNLGRSILEGEAEPNTGFPGVIAGADKERVLRAPAAGILVTNKVIGDMVKSGDEVLSVEGLPVKAAISGVIRGLLRDGASVHKGMKLGDIDPRGIKEYCYTISDKARTISGGVLEAILARFAE